MTRDEFLDEVHDILSEYTDEPAGRGAGYGLTDIGFETLEELANKLFGKEESIMLYRYAVVRKDFEGKEKDIIKEGSMLATDEKNIDQRVLVSLVKDENIHFNLDTDEILIRTF
jgi:hypothetical protein